MQDQLRQASEFIDRLQSLPDADTCWEAFLQEVQSYGVRWALYGFMRGYEKRDMQLIYFTNYPPEWHEAYDQLGGPDNDASVQHCFVSTDDLRWYEPERMAALPAKQLAVEKMAQAHGATSGITFPLRSGPEIDEWGGVGFGTDMTNEAFDTLLAERGDYLRLISQLFHATVLSRPLAANVKRLTEKEREALMLSAKGFSSKGIAAELGITTSAVDLRLKSARQKMSSSTTTQAVAEALRLHVFKT